MCGVRVSSGNTSVWSPTAAAAAGAAARLSVEPISRTTLDMPGRVMRSRSLSDCAERAWGGYRRLSCIDGVTEHSVKRVKVVFAASSPFNSITMVSYIARHCWRHVSLPALQNLALIQRTKLQVSLQSSVLEALSVYLFIAVNNVAKSLQHSKNCALQHILNFEAFG